MLNICILFGGVSPEHEVSLRSAESVLNNIDKTKYSLYPVGIKKDGSWHLFGGNDYSELPAGTWEYHPDNLPAIISPVHGQGLLVFSPDGVETVPLDCVFPVLHGENGEDGSIQGLMQVAAIPCVGPGVCAAASSMDKTLTKLVADSEGVRQAAWTLIRASRLERHMDDALDQVEAKFQYPVFVKPAGTGSSVGVTKAHDREELAKALLLAGKYDDKVMVEEFIRGREIEVAVLGNGEPCASVCGEIDPGADFYDYDTKYITDTSVAYIPARISEKTAEKVRDTAVKMYKALGCRGMSRVDFFVTYDDEQVIFNEINGIPGFTSISMYAKLMDASGIEYPDLLDKLIALAMDD